MEKLINYAIALATFFVVISNVSKGEASESKNIREMIAQNYGIENFDQIEEIKFTFNVDLGTKQAHRSWHWWPKADRVRFISPEDAAKIVEYQRSEIEKNQSGDLKKIDAKFINDQYWLLFPLHLVWDNETKIEEVSDRTLPIRGGSARCVTVTYPTTGGYTPGDVYELFLDDNYRLVQWIYRKGGASEPTRISTWEDHQELGPVTLSLEHNWEEKNFRVWFTDVAVKELGSDIWHNSR